MGKTRIDAKIDLSEALRLRFKNGLNDVEIAKIFGVSKQAVNQRLAEFSEHLPNPESVLAFRDNKAGVLESVEFALLTDILDPERRAKASLNNTAYTYQQIATQNRLERGSATQIIDTLQVTASLSDLEARREKLLKEITVQPVVQPDSQVK